MGTWTEISLAEKPCDLFEPGDPNEHGYVLIYLHDVDQQRLVDNPTYNEQFEELGLPVIAPHTRRSWWTDRVCPEFDAALTAERHVLQNVVPYIEERWGSRPPRIGLFGIGMGGQGALRISFKHPDTFPVVAGVSPAIDFQHRFDDDEWLQQMYADPESIRQETATLYIHPLNWPRHQFFCCDPDDGQWWDGVDRLRMKLRSLGVPHESDLETRGGGHDFKYFNGMAKQTIQFLAGALDKERRRLV